MTASLPAMAAILAGRATVLAVPARLARSRGNRV